MYTKGGEPPNPTIRRRKVKMLHQNDQMSFPALARRLGGGLAVMMLAGSVNAQSGEEATSEESEELIELSVFEVETTGDKGYGTTHTLGGTRVNIALENVPLSVISLNREFIRDSGALEISEAIGYVSGMSKVASPLEGQFSLRGYNISGADFRDGLPDETIAHGAKTLDMGSIERIEVIKGPAGVLYGAHTLGGIVNLVSKKPLPERRTMLRFTFGEFNFYKGEFDITGPLDKEQNIRYRLVAGYQNGETMWGRRRNRTIFNPVVSFHLNERTSFWGRFEYQNNDVDSTSVQWRIDNTKAISTFLPRVYTLEDTDTGVVNLAFKYEVGFQTNFDLMGTEWDMRLVARYNASDNEKIKYQAGRINFIDAEGNQFATERDPEGRWDNPAWSTLTMDRARRVGLQDWRRSNINVDLVGNFQTGAVTHKLLTYTSVTYADWWFYRTYHPYPDIDLFNRVFHDDPKSVAEATGPEQLQHHRETNDFTFAWGVQDNARLFEERLILVGGARYDWGQGDFYDHRRGTASEDTNHDWSFKFGVVGKPRSGTSLFYNFSQTFQPQSGTLPNGTPIENLLGEVNEVGIKVDLFEHRLVATGSYFDMRLKNQIIDSPGFLQPDGTISGGEPVQEGENRTDGYEIDLRWQPVDSITLLAAYGWLESVNEEGTRQRGVGQGNNYKFFGRYSVLEGPVKGLSLGLGYSFTNERAGDRPDSYTLPSFGVWNGMLAYDRGNWRFQLNGFNLGDETYLFAVSGANIRVADKRHFRASVTYRF